MNKFFVCFRFCFCFSDTSKIKKLLIELSSIVKDSKSNAQISSYGACCRRNRLIRIKTPRVREKIFFNRHLFRKLSFTFSYNCRKGRYFYWKRLESWGFFSFSTLLIPMSDQDRNSPHNINTKSRRQVMRTKKSINWGIISWSNNKFLVVKSEALYSKL